MSCPFQRAQVVELVDTRVSEARDESRAGSSPALGTILRSKSYGWHAMPDAVKHVTRTRTGLTERALASGEGAIRRIDGEASLRSRITNHSVTRPETRSLQAPMVGAARSRMWLSGKSLDEWLGES